LASRVAFEVYANDPFLAISDYRLRPADTLSRAAPVNPAMAGELLSDEPVAAVKNHQGKDGIKYNPSRSAA
jgi:hypothetical protein